MINAVILDDEQHCVNLLENLINSSGEIILLASYTNAEQALKEMQNNSPDVLFLDIQLGNQSGFDFLQKINKVDFEIIFTTAFSEYAIQAFRLSAVDYLLKPIDEKDFHDAIVKLKKRRNQSAISQQLDILFHNLEENTSSKKIHVSTQDSILFIDLEDILYCQADINYTYLHVFKNAKYTVSKSLKHFEKLLIPFNFARIHNSYIVNLNHVVKYTKGKGGYVTLKNNTVLPVSTRRKEDFLNRLR